MSQEQKVPQQIINFYLECGIGRSQIERCWILSGYNEDKMGDHIWKSQDIIVQQDPPQNNNVNEDGFEASQLEKHVSKMIQQVVKRKQRNPYCFVGIENLENDCNLNIMLQLFHQIPQIYEFILKMQNNNQSLSGQFIRKIQLLLTELTVSNSSFISSKQILNAPIWNQQEKDYFEIQKDPIIIFFLVLKKIDTCFMELNRQQVIINDNFLIGEFNQLFNSVILNNYRQEKEYVLIADMKQHSVFSFLYEQFKQKVSVLPQILCIQIKRNQENNIRLEKAFDINLVLELEFLKPNFQGSVGMNQVNYQSIYDDLKQLDKDLRNISQTIKIFTEEGNQLDVIKILQSKQNTLENQVKIKQDYIDQQKQILEFQQFNENNTKYYVHSIALQQGYSNSNSSILYVYNFTNNKWLKYSNSICQEEGEDQVTLNSQKHALFVTYINANLIQQFKQHQRNLTEVGNKISANVSYDLNSDQYLRSIIPKDVLMEAYKNNLENKKKFENGY